ncbi:hypothetical protein QOZ98_000102 [Planomicrobium stackebrandtii]|uniref:Uncharacterized protein n=1 Tax=Planomicrobium stackebrandtii TaxID=253160 RepID=A0ABU0GPJ6_9BACL|nr:DUF5996 family protein [Planomicrobium stackebrandtii]MDQ0427277.1 hypothetical protein [Planomicrobium stackebrandtii]
MTLDIIRHSEWAETKFTLHLISQILGKIKLETAQQEPQWAHVALTVTTDGFSTGLLFVQNTSFQIDVDIRNSRILVNVEGDVQSIELKTSKSIKDYFEEIFGTLSERGINLTINPKPQEMAYKNKLDEDTAPLTFDQHQAMRGLQLFQFALREQSKFVGPLRCRKMKPALFWGTFDVSLLILHGIMEPFPEDKVIEKAAFDEQMIEYGFWLGDEQVDVPTFFVLPYPFLYKDLNSDALKPPQAYFDPTKGEYFLDLESIAGSASLSDTIQEFFHSSFTLLIEELGWEGCASYFIPLQMKEQKINN